MKVSRITVGRLYNLGNYEHVRYELTVDVKDDESAAVAILGIERILAGLAPLRFVKDKSQLDRLASEIEEMQKMPAVEWERRYGHCVGTPTEIIARYKADFEKEKSKTADAVVRAQTARKLFDDLGGASQWKDAKMDWDWDQGGDL
ncbi:MAG: hypothetical protein EB141_07590 [Verrucomicrobia bacterium]|nr:hypothetical protein [Verrucomicrobiota bacterium]NBV22279.1 hypothetical protein [Pseudomonadota bacterium]NDA68406.1 hypothetical protein [Verrucomicrobiota bacterium]NDB75491.1 hypothetical protein [Verrucomicrobiota bacterium]NDD38984.1 hypothetical protein [Verrucomicrobiota bacterium]